MRARRVLTATGLIAAYVIGIVAIVFATPSRGLSVLTPLALNAETTPVMDARQSAPITIALRELTVTPRRAERGTLTLADADDESAIPVAPDQAVTIGQSEFTVSAIRNWSGLTYQPPGTPFVNIALQPPGEAWLENLFVPEGGYIIVSRALAVQFPSEGEPPSARWGVKEGERTHWFTSFRPGTGIELADGASITLLAHRPSGRVLLERTQGSETTRQWVDANQPETSQLYVYEDPSVIPISVEVSLNDSFEWSMAVFERDLTLHAGPVVEGAILREPVTGWAIRVDQVLSGAVPVLADESRLFELVLQNESHVLRVREEQSIRLGDIELRFQPEIQPSTAKAVLHVSGAGIPEGSSDITIGSGERITIGQWTFSRVQPADENAIVVQTDGEARPPALRWQLIIVLTAMLVVLSVIAWKRA